LQANNYNLQYFAQCFKDSPTLILMNSQGMIYKVQEKGAGSAEKNGE